MSPGANSLLAFAVFIAIALEFGILLAIGYVALRFATRFVQMRKDIDELKLAVRELGHRA